MELSAPTLLQGLAVLFGLLGVLGGSVAVARAAGVKANLELLRGEVSDLTAANARLSGERVGLQREVEVLRDLVTSRADIERLAGEVHAVLEHIRADHGGVMGVFEDWIREAWGEEERREGAQRLRPRGRHTGQGGPEGGPDGPTRG
jgi:hypothetical protein